AVEPRQRPRDVNAMIRRAVDLSHAMLRPNGGNRIESEVMEHVNVGSRRTAQRNAFGSRTIRSFCGVVENLVPEFAEPACDQIVNVLRRARRLMAKGDAHSMTVLDGVAVIRVERDAHR